MAPEQQNEENELVDDEFLMSLAQRLPVYETVAEKYISVRMNHR